MELEIGSAAVAGELSGLAIADSLAEAIIGRGGGHAVHASSFG
jgi:hypothetical protein